MLNQSGGHFRLQHLQAIAMLMSPISDISRRFDVKSSIKRVDSLLIRWTLHCLNTNALKAEIKPHVGDAPAMVADMLTQARFDVDLYRWKLAALEYLQGNPRNLQRYRNGCEQMRDAIGMAGVNPPKVEQSLIYAEGEKVLLKALTDVAPVMLSLYRRKVNFAANLLQADPLGLLKERAVLTFRWEYPFCRNPGACLNTAVVNYANNIVRDISSMKRSLFIYDKGDATHEATRTPKMTTVEEIATMPDATPHVSDLHFDLKALPPFDQRVVEVILMEVDGDNCQQRVARLLGASEEKVGRAFGRITKYLSGESSA